MSAEPDDDDDADAGGPTYLYKPSLMGAPWELRLRNQGLEWRLGRHTGVVRYDRIKRVRLSFRPVTMQTQRFLTEVWSDDAPKISIASVSWRSVLEQARQDPEYNSFVAELHRRMAQAGTRASFSTGMPVATYAIGILVYIGAMLAFAGIMVRALQLAEWSAAGLIGVFFALFAWQVGVYFRRNRPGRYAPDALPADAMPKT